MYNSWPGIKNPVKKTLIPYELHKNAAESGYIYQYQHSLSNPSHSNLWNNKNQDPIEIETMIGPTCTVGAHNNFTQFGPCPNEIQPTSQPNYTAPVNIYPDYFVMDWTMLFVPDYNDTPPYKNNTPNTPYNITYGTTYYDITYEGGAMRESYYQRCIPVFPYGSLSGWNDFSCDFITINSNHTAYLILNETDKPKDAPDCCIIGQPFHVPPKTFANGLTVKFQSMVDNVNVNWNAIWLSGAGIFNYGFNHDNIPWIFYMQGIPDVANWCYQKFYNFNTVKPDQHVWTIPPKCYDAKHCPGWPVTPIPPI